MNRRYYIYVGLIALLVVINLGRWWLVSENDDEASAASSRVFQPEDFRLLVDLPATGNPRRNLFQQHSGAKRLMPTQNKPASVVAQAPELPGQIEADAAADALGKLRLLGVVFRSGRGQAYLAMEKENVIAFAGDRVLGQFIVDKVDLDAVELRDLKSNINRRVPVSGK